ncbi:MAG: Hsp20/alpha crystallin family protein, partial [Deltaproteobacteria bacterium]
MWTEWNEIDRMFDTMGLLHSRMNRLFPDYSRSLTLPAWDVTQSGPRTNLYDVGDLLEMKVEVPGIEKDDLNIKVQ